MNLPCHQYFNCDPTHQEVYSTDQSLVYVRCLDCGLIWRSPGSFSVIKEYGESYVESKNYLKNRKHKIKKATWLIHSALHFKHDIQSLLEIGSSIGSTLEAARNLGLEQVGIDVNEYAVDYCRRAGLNADTRTIDNILEEGRHFDMVFMQHVLEHFENPFQTLNQCRELLNEDGIIVILVPNSAYKKSANLREKHRFYSMAGVGSEHFVYFDYPSLVRVLDQEGFTVLQQNYPWTMPGYFNVEACINRISRRFLTFFHMDQEILVIAQKKSAYIPGIHFESR